MRRAMAVVAMVLVLATVWTATSFAEAAPPVAVDGGVKFSYEDLSASTVHLAGEFNGWDPTAIPMSDDNGDGVWEVVTDLLQAGRSYEYKFVVDGGVAWREDPSNPNTVDDNHGGVNTIVSVADDGSVVLGYLGGVGESAFEPVVDELELLGTKLYVAIIWHQHQPKYLKDLSLIHI